MTERILTVCSACKPTLDLMIEERQEARMLRHDAERKIGLLEGELERDTKLREDAWGRIRDLSWAMARAMRVIMGLSVGQMAESHDEWKPVTSEAMELQLRRLADELAQLNAKTKEEVSG